MQEGETTGEKCDGNGGSPWEFRSLYFFFPTGNMKTTRGFKKKSKKHKIYIFNR